MWTNAKCLCWFLLKKILGNFFVILTGYFFLILFFCWNYFCVEDLWPEKNAFPCEWEKFFDKSCPTFPEAGVFTGLFPDPINQKNLVGSDPALVTTLESNSKNFDFAVYYSKSILWPRQFQDSFDCFFNNFWIKWHFVLFILYFIDYLSFYLFLLRIFIFFNFLNLDFRFS